MKLTKFVHACVLVEDEEHTALFDPGGFSWSSGLIHVEAWPKLDYVLITHEHFDHFDEDFVKAVFEKFPDVKFYGTEEVIVKLKAMGITSAYSESKDPNIRMVSLDHDPMFPLNPGKMSQNVAFHYKNKISHPGDSAHLTESCPILFTPLAGPWQSAIDGVTLAYNLKPKVVLPIHDWMWNDEWRTYMYDWMERCFKEHDIVSLKPVNGESFEV